MKRLLPLLLLATTAMVGCVSTAAYQCVGEPEGQLLSTHETNATFNGFELRPCVHLTADCPDQCDHGGIFATFTICDYRDYEKLDYYGDEKQTLFAIRIASAKDVPDPTLSPALRKVLLKLTPGETVELDWAHVYVAYPNGLHTPERIVTRLAQ